MRRLEFTFFPIGHPRLGATADGHTPSAASRREGLTVEEAPGRSIRKKGEMKG